MSINLDQQLCIKNIILDADDTIWHSAKFYQNTLDNFVALMMSYGFSKDEIISLCKEKDYKRFELGQYGVTLFNSSLYDVFCEKVVCPLDKDIVKLKQILHHHYHHPIILFESIDQTFEMFQYYKTRLFLCTKGEIEHQSFKINKSGIAHYFEDIAIVKSKDKNMYQDLVKKWRLIEDQTMVIGDNYSDDVLTPQKLGMYAAYISPPEKKYDSQTNTSICISKISDIFSYLVAPEKAKKSLFLGI